MPSRKATNEIYRLQSEIGNEIARDAPEIAQGIFGAPKDQPDVVSLSNEKLDEIYRQAYLREDRQWLQAEAKRDPLQFEKITDRIGVVMPPAGMEPPPPGAFARAAPAPPAALPPAPNAVPVPLPAPVAPVAAIPPVVPPPAALPAVILGPNGQPLPPSGVV